MKNSVLNYETVALPLSYIGIRQTQNIPYPLKNGSDFCSHNPVESMVRIRKRGKHPMVKICPPFIIVHWIWGIKTNQSFNFPCALLSKQTNQRRVFMLNNPQTDQGRDRMNTGFQRGAENMSRTTTPTANREAETQPAAKARKGASAGGSSGTGSFTVPTHDEIAARAYQIYCKKGRPEGRDTENWLEAEAELQRERRGAKR